MLLNCIEGKKDIKDVLDTYKNNVPLRKQILKKVINTLKDGYERKQNATGFKARKTQNVGFGGNTAGGAGNTGGLRRRGYGAEVARYSISEPSYTDRMVDISDVMTVAEHKAATLENAKRMASEGVDAQKIGRKVVRIYIQGRS